VHARHKNRSAAGGIVVARLDALQAAGFAGPDGTQPFQGYALALFQNALVPHGQHQLLFRIQFLNASRGLTPEVTFQYPIGPPLGAQQIAQSLRPRWRLPRTQNVAPQFAEQKTILAMTQLYDGLQRGQERAYEALIESCIQFDQKRPDEGFQLLT
jgi:hypothetical protein